MSQPQKILSSLGPRPRLTFVICEGRVAEIWVNGRAPLIMIRDYDCGETDPNPSYDCDGFAYTNINWRAPAWALGLLLSPPPVERCLPRESNKTHAIHYCRKSPI